MPNYISTLHLHAPILIFFKILESNTLGRKYYFPKLSF